jgi:predicted enzyme related to lactoylglutathione lyase
MSRITHFDIYADDPERALKFYGDVFGWQSTRWEGPMDYWLVTTGPDDKPGINGGISRRQDPADRIVNTIDVGSVDEVTAKVTSAGGQVIVPKTAIPKVGWFVLCLDTEGNKFGLMEEDPNAQ